MKTHTCVSDSRSLHWSKELELKRCQRGSNKSKINQQTSSLPAFCPLKACQLRELLTIKLTNSGTCHFLSHIFQPFKCVRTFEGQRDLRNSFLLNQLYSSLFSSPKFKLIHSSDYSLMTKQFSLADRLQSEKIFNMAKMCIALRFWSFGWSNFVSHLLCPCICWAVRQAFQWPCSRPFRLAYTWCIYDRSTCQHWSHSRGNRRSRPAANCGRS